MLIHLPNDHEIGFECMFPNRCLRAIFKVNPLQKKEQQQ